MENIGSSGGDVTWIIWAFAIPFILWFGGDIVCRIIDICYSNTKTVFLPVYVTVPTEESSVEEKSCEKKQDPVQSCETDQTMVDQAISGLSNLGLKKKDAKKLVDGVCSTKTYDSVEKLLADCFSQL